VLADLGVVLWCATALAFESPVRRRSNLQKTPPLFHPVRDATEVVMQYVRFGRLHKLHPRVRAGCTCDTVPRHYQVDHFVDYAARRFAGVPVRVNDTPYLLSQASTSRFGRLEGHLLVGCTEDYFRRKRQEHAMGWFAFSVNRNEPWFDQRNATVADKQQLAKQFTPLIPCFMDTGGRWKIDERRIWLLTTAPWVVSFMLLFVSVYGTSAVAVEKKRQWPWWVAVAMLSVAVVLFVIAFVTLFDCFLRRPAPTTTVHPLKKTTYRTEAKSGKGSGGKLFSNPVLDPKEFDRLSSAFLQAYKEGGYTSAAATLADFAKQHNRTLGGWCIMPFCPQYYAYVLQMLLSCLIHQKNVAERTALKDHITTEYVKSQVELHKEIAGKP